MNKHDDNDDGVTYAENPLDTAWREYERTRLMTLRRRRRVYLPIMAVGFAVWCVMVIGFETVNGVALLALVAMTLPVIGVLADAHQANRALDNYCEEARRFDTRINRIIRHFEEQEQNR